MPKGGARPGAGRPVGSHNRSNGEFRASFQIYVPGAARRLAVLADLIPPSKLRSREKPSPNHSVQVACLREILDRALGKATQPLSHSVDGQAFEALLERLGRGAAPVVPAMIEASVKVIDVPTEDDGSVDSLISRL